MLMKYFKKRWECMKAYKIFWLNLAAIIIISIVVSGGMFLAMKWEQIHLKDGLKKVLSTYPIKNLETLYEIMVTIIPIMKIMIKTHGI